MKVTTLTLMRVNLIRFTPFKLEIPTNTSQNNVYFKTILFKSIILKIQISRFPICDLVYTLR